MKYHANRDKSLTLNALLLACELLPFPLREGLQLPDGEVAIYQRPGQQTDGLFLRLEDGSQRLAGRSFFLKLALSGLASRALLLKLGLGGFPGCALLLELRIHPSERHLPLVKLGLSCSMRCTLQPECVLQLDQLFPSLEAFSHPLLHHGAGPLQHEGLPILLLLKFTNPSE